MAAIDDFIATLNDPIVPKAVPSPADITAQLAPVTTNEVARTFARSTPGLGQEQVPRHPISAEDKFRAENARPDVPLYQRSSEQTGGHPELGQPQIGLTSPMFRFQMARRQGMQEQLKYAKSQLGDENARLSKDGHDIIVTIPDNETGKTKDVVVNDKDITLGDFAALAAHAPEFAGAVAGLAAARTGKLGNIKGIFGFLKDAFAGAVGQETGGGLAEAGTRLQDMEVVNPGQLTQERAAAAVGDFAGNVVLGGLAKGGDEALQFLQAPFSAARGQLKAEGMDFLAKDRLAAATGVPLKYSAGQASGSAPVIMGEEYLKSTPAGQAVLSPLFREQTANKQAIFDALTRGTGTDEEVGRELIGRLQATRDVGETALQGAKTQLEQKGAAAVKGGLASVSTAPELTPIQAGEKLRGEVLKEHGDIMAQNRANYTDAYAVEGAQDPIIPTDSISKAIGDIKLPMRTIEKEVKAFDAYGSPIAKTTSTREPVSEFLHPEVEQFLGTKLDKKMPLAEVVQMRDMLYDEIARGEAVKGIPTKQLSQIGRSMTEAIDKGIADLPAGSELRTKLTKANQFYKDKVLKFEEAGIADLFKDIKDPGYKESSQIIKRLASDPDKYQRTIKLLGPTSEGAKTVRGFIRDDLLRRSAFDIQPGRMQASRFIKNLRQLREEHPDIYNDVIGPRGDALLEDATLMGTAQGDISISDAQKALSGKSMKINALQDMQQKQLAVDQAEGNQLIKSFTKGNLDFNTINPEKVVNSFLAKGTESEIKTFMDALRADNPAMAKRVERKMTEKFIGDAGGMDATDESINAILKNKEIAGKYESVLGPRQWNLLKDLMGYLGPIRYAKGVAGGTGMLVKGSKIGAFVKTMFSFTNPTKEIYDIVTTRFISSFVTSSTFRAWVENTPKELFPDLGKAVVLSGPFISALSEDIKDKSKLAEVIIGIRKAAGGLIHKPAPAPAPRLQMSETEFLRSLDIKP